MEPALTGHFRRLTVHPRSEKADGHESQKTKCEAMLLFAIHKGTEYRRCLTKTRNVAVLGDITPIPSACPQGGRKLNWRKIPITLIYHEKGERKAHTCAIAWLQQ